MTYFLLTYLLYYHRQTLDKHISDRTVIEKLLKAKKDRTKTTLTSDNITTL